MLVALDLERRTEHDLQATLTHMQTTLSRVKEQSKSLEEELNAVKRAVQTERTEKERQTKALESQRSRDSLELRVLQDILGVRIEGVTRQSSVLLLGFLFSIMGLTSQIPNRKCPAYALHAHRPE